MISKIIEYLIRHTESYQFMQLKIEDLKFQESILEKESNRYSKAVQNMEISLSNFLTVREHTEDIHGFLKSVAIDNAHREPIVIEAMKERRFLAKDVDYLKFWDGELCDAEVTSSVDITSFFDQTLPDTISAKTTIRLPEKIIHMVKAF